MSNLLGADIVSSLTAFEKAPPGFLKHARAVSKIMLELADDKCYSDETRQQIRNVKNAMEWKVGSLTLDAFPSDYGRSLTHEQEFHLSLAIMESCRDAIGKIDGLQVVDNGSIIKMRTLALPLEKDFSVLNDPLQRIYATLRYSSSRRLNPNGIPENKEGMDDGNRFPL